MITVFSPDHRRHAASKELYRGRLVDAFETPERADAVHRAVLSAGLGEVVAPTEHGLAPLERVHDAAYLRFLARAWDEWQALGNDTDILPAVWPGRTLRTDVSPTNFAARFGRYALDSGTPFTAGSWAAARAGADTALTARELVERGERAAFALCRPPGHHAGADFFAGYCFLNNAAITAQACLDRGAQRVAILDVDFHHGNGTQSLFYDRSDVLFVSIHGDPTTEYPFYLGYADETGEGEGAGYNLNLPLPAGSDNDRWFAALDVAVQRVQAHDPDVLVVSLGVDTYVGDPISTFRLDLPEYRELGRRLAVLGRPTVFLMEGGYATDAIGRNVAAVLTAFEAAPLRGA